MVCTNTNRAWSMLVMNCRERLMWSLFVEAEEVEPRLLPTAELDFSVSMCDTFW